MRFKHERIITFDISREHSSRLSIDTTSTFPLFFNTTFLFIKELREHFSINSCFEWSWLGYTPIQVINCEICC